MRSRQGFSLIELVIVVVIIGVLGAIAIPRLSRGSDGARVNAFISEINTFANAIDRYQQQTQGDVADASTGVFPIEMRGYLHQRSWEKATPLGGRWDIEANDNGVALGVGVHYMSGTPEIKSLLQVDRSIDDGDLSTGAFKKIASRRYYLVLDH